MQKHTTPKALIFPKFTTISLAFDSAKIMAWVWSFVCNLIKDGDTNHAFTIIAISQQQNGSFIFDVIS